MHRHHSLDLIAQAFSTSRICVAMLCLVTFMGVGSSAYAQDAAYNLRLLKRIYALDNLANMSSLDDLGVEMSEAAVPENATPQSGYVGVTYNFEVRVSSHLLPLVDGVMSGAKRRIQDKYPQVGLEGKIQINRLCISRKDFFEEFANLKFFLSDFPPEPFDPDFDRPRPTVRFSSKEERQYGPAFNEFNLVGFMVEFKKSCLEKFNFSQNVGRM